MAYSIFKYTLDVNDSEHFVELPHGAEILSAAVQCGSIVFWAKVPNDKPLTARVEFLVAHTGFDAVKGSDRFIGTCLFHGGNIVFHVFVRGGE